MQALLSAEAWLGAGLIFIMRVANMSLDTVRVMMVMRSKKTIAWVLGFIQTVIYVVVLGSVMKDLNNVLNMIAYAGGFATGNVVGMWVEEKMAIGHINMRIISTTLGAEVAAGLREAGYAVTAIAAQGKDGDVTLLNASLFRRQVGDMMDRVREIDPDAFMTAEDMRPVQRGFWRA